MTTTGEQIRAARERAGLTQGELAQRAGVSLRTVGNWERGESDPRNRLGRLRELLPDLDRTDDRGVDLRSASDAEVLAEIARRFARGQRGGEGHVRAPSIDEVASVPTVSESGAGDETATVPPEGEASQQPTHDRDRPGPDE